MQSCARRVPIFSNLDDDEIKKVDRIAKSRIYRKGDIIFTEGDAPAVLYIIHEGRIKLYRDTEDGREVIMNILGNGEFFGEMTLFTGEPLKASAVALDDSILCSISRSDMLVILNENPSIAVKIMEILTRRLTYAENRIEDMVSKDIEGRLLGFIRSLVKDRSKKEVELGLTRREIADMLGTTQETVSRTFSNLESDGILKVKGHKRIEILDMDAIFEMD